MEAQRQLTGWRDFTQSSPHLDVRNTLARSSATIGREFDFTESCDVGQSTATDSRYAAGT